MRYGNLAGLLILAALAYAMYAIASALLGR